MTGKRLAKENCSSVFSRHSTFLARSVVRSFSCLIFSLLLILLSLLSLSSKLSKTTIVMMKRLSNFSSREESDRERVLCHTPHIHVSIQSSLFISAMVGYPHTIQLQLHKRGHTKMADANKGMNVSSGSSCPTLICTISHLLNVHSDCSFNWHDSPLSFLKGTHQTRVSCVCLSTC
jgi:hypothetical protein